MTDRLIERKKKSVLNKTPNRNETENTFSK